MESGKCAMSWCIASFCCGGREREREREGRVAKGKEQATEGKKKKKRCWTIGLAFSCALLGCGNIFSSLSVLITQAGLEKKKVVGDEIGT